MAHGVEGTVELGGDLADVHHPAAQLGVPRLLVVGLGLGETGALGVQVERLTAAGRSLGRREPLEAQRGTAALLNR